MKPFEYAMVAAVSNNVINVRIVKEVDVDRTLSLVGKHPATNFNLYAPVEFAEIVKKAYSIV